MKPELIQFEIWNLYGNVLWEILKQCVWEKESPRDSNVPLKNPEGGFVGGSGGGSSG